MIDGGMEAWNQRCWAIRERGVMRTGLQRRWGDGDGVYSVGETRTGARAEGGQDLWEEMDSGWIKGECMLCGGRDCGLRARRKMCLENGLKGIVCSEDRRMEVLREAIGMKDVGMMRGALANGIREE
ncbi:unnamed protein product [Calypogeia fissa]